MIAYQRQRVRGRDTFKRDVKYDSPSLKYIITYIPYLMSCNLLDSF